MDNGLPRMEVEAAPSAFRAWVELVWLCLWRQARARQMVWIALGLLGLTTTIVALNTAAGRWTLKNRWISGRINTYQQWLDHQARAAGAAVFDENLQSVPPRPFVLPPPKPGLRIA